MPKFEIGIDFEVSGLVYVEQEAESEDDAVALVESRKDDLVSKELGTGAGNWTTSIVDVIPNQEGT